MVDLPEPSNSRRSITPSQCPRDYMNSTWTLFRRHCCIEIFLANSLDVFIFVSFLLFLSRPLWFLDYTIYWFSSLSQGPRGPKGDRGPQGIEGATGEKVSNKILQPKWTADRSWQVLESIAICVFSHFLFKHLTDCENRRDSASFPQQSTLKSVVVSANVIALCLQDIWDSSWVSAE